MKTDNLSDSTRIALRIYHFGKVNQAWTFPIKGNENFRDEFIRTARRGRGGKERKYHRKFIISEDKTHFCIWRTI